MLQCWLNNEMFEDLDNIIIVNACLHVCIVLKAEH